MLRSQRFSHGPISSESPLSTGARNRTFVADTLAMGPHAGLTGAVVDEPSGGAGVHGVAVSVVDAQADTWGESGRRMVAQVEVWWVRGGGRSSHHTAAADCRGSDRRPHPRCHVRHSHREPSLSQSQLTGNGNFPRWAHFRVGSTHVQGRI
jgi:hypothetical protein